MRGNYNNALFQYFIHLNGYTKRMKSDYNGAWFTAKMVITRE